MVWSIVLLLFFSSAEVGLLVQAVHSFRADSRRAPHQRTNGYLYLMLGESAAVTMFGYHHLLAALIPDPLESGIGWVAIIAGIVTSILLIVHLIRVASSRRVKL
jgi:hypothetical protein